MHFLKRIKQNKNPMASAESLVLHFEDNDSIVNSKNIYLMTP